MRRLPDDTLMVTASQAVERILAGGGDADDVLRAVVEALAGEPEISWAGIRFLEGGALVAGPSAGSPDEPRRRESPIVYREAPVGQLVVDGGVEQPLVDEVAALISPYVLLGWDTGGAAWEP